MARVYPRKGQVTIFILVALLLVALILVFFFLRNVAPESESFDEGGTFLDLKECAKEAVQNELKRIYEKGWVLDTRNNISYRGVPYTYLCHTHDYGAPCYNRFPMLEEKVETALRDETKDDLNDCFYTLKSDLEARGYTVEGKPTQYALDILPGQIKITLQKPILLTKGEAKREMRSFDTSLVSSAYELLQMTREIVNSEASSCTFSRTAFTFLYPQFFIDRIVYRDAHLYEVGYLPTAERVKFATRGCVRL